MPSITELRILPPFGIARLGSSPDPMVNYEATVDRDDPLAARRLTGAPTFVVDRASGAISSCVEQPDVRFRDRRGRIRPVAPFFEVWARTGDVLRPLTREMLEASGFSANDVVWKVTTANLKISRRTADERDRISAESGPFSDHRIHLLRGHCRNFVDGGTLPLGQVRYIRPTAAFPEIRLRFTPPKGRLYGARKTARFLEGTPVIYRDQRNSWTDHTDPGRPDTTEPGGIFANLFSARREEGVSLGFIDDVSDGVIEVELLSSKRARRPPLRALARVAVGPPPFAPDSFPIRTIADEIEQALDGPGAGEPGTPEGGDPAEIAARAEEIVRRGAETVRLMNVAAMNGPANRAATTTMPSHDSRSYGRLYEPVMAPVLADTLAILALHRSILTALKSGTAPWFTDALRRHDEIGDLTDAARRKMPALLRGSDGRYLALTRRQAAIVRAAAVRGTRAGAPSPDRKP